MSAVERRRLGAALVERTRAGPAQKQGGAKVVVRGAAVGRGVHFRCHGARCRVASEEHLAPLAHGLCCNQEQSGAVRSNQEQSEAPHASRTGVVFGADAE